MATAHDRAANRIAKTEGTEYNKGQGPDVQTSTRAIEVETKDTARDGLRQLQGFKKPVYIAGADKQATEAAIKATEGTTVGVMNSQGKIIKRSARKRK